MERRGVILVDSTHELHPNNRCEAIKSRAQQVIGSIRSQLKIAEKELPFNIRSHARSQRSGVRVLRSIYEGSEDSEHVRVVFCDEPMPDTFVQTFFPKNKLVIGIEESSHSHGIYSNGQRNGCRIIIGKSKASRVIEDVFIDIFVGRWMASTPTLDGLIKQHGHDALYQEKAKHYRLNSQKSWLTMVSRDAGYAPLSSLNKIDDDDIVGRASATISEWLAFIAQLTTKSVPTAAIKSVPATAEPPKKVVLDRIEDLPKLGGQLPARAIRLAASKLPEGNYLVMILRRASAARKSPKTRGKIESIFGKRSRINSFRFFNSEDFSSQRSNISDLLRSRFVAGVEVNVSNGQLTVNKLLLGDEP